MSEQQGSKPAAAGPWREEPTLQRCASRPTAADHPERPHALTVAWLGRVDYAAALELQNSLVAARLNDAIGDLLLLLEHPPVFTLGRGADERYLLNPADIPVYRVSRGGQVTYHGPGQLIGYPVVRLEGSERDVIRYLRNIEQVLIQALAGLGIEAGRRQGLTGVWIGARKIASIGVGFRRWVSLHGFALNVTTDLRCFDAIVPCGIAGCRMTSIAEQGYSQISMDAMANRVAPAFAAVYGYGQISATSADQLWRMAACAGPGVEARR